MTLELVWILIGELGFVFTLIYWIVLIKQPSILQIILCFMRIKHIEVNCHITQYHVVETKNTETRYLEHVH